MSKPVAMLFLTARVWSSIIQIPTKNRGKGKYREAYTTVLQRNHPVASSDKPVRSLKIASSAHAILSRISHLLFNQEQKKVKTKEGEKFGIKSHAH